MRTPEPERAPASCAALPAYDEAGEASVLGAVLSVVDWLWVVESLGLETGASDWVVVEEPPGAVELLLLPQAAALSAASPRKSATSDFRMRYLVFGSVPGMDPSGLSAGPRRLGSTAPLRRPEP
jgi:hypothetical protein